MTARYIFQNNVTSSKRGVDQRFKHGIEMPRNASHAFEIDKANGDSFWQDSIDKEMKGLLRFIDLIFPNVIC